jgi:membrane fusion protein, heavy metal efflux system
MSKQQALCRQTSAAILVSVALAAAVLSGCKPNTAEASKVPEKRPASDPLTIKVAQSLQEQIRVGEPKWSQVAKRQEVAGRIEADATRQARVGSPVKGRISDLLVMEGERVRRGQALATLYSTDLSDAQFAFIKAVSQQHLSETAAKRGKQLLEADVIGSAELQRRQAELLQANAEVAALRQQLEALGMSDAALRDLELTRKLNSKYPIVASIDGTVLERMVTVGQIVQPAEIAFMIADLSTVWVVADIPEQTAGEITVGKDVEAEIPALPGLVVKGNLSFVSATVNPESRTVRVRMTVPNSRGRLKPAMLATMALKDRAERDLTVPATAVIREEDKDNVFVQKAPNTYVLRQVQLGGEAGDSRVLLSGLEPGEKIVLDGAFHVNNERKRALQGGS